MTIEKILESEVDLVGIPKRSFFQILAEYSSDKLEKDRLLEFCSGRGFNLKRDQALNLMFALVHIWIRKWLSPELAEGTDDRWDYANRPRRTLAEALRDFPKSVSDLPVEALVRVLIRSIDAS